MAAFVANVMAAFLLFEKASKSNFNMLFFIQFPRSVLAQAAAWAGRAHTGSILY